MVKPTRSTFLVLSLLLSGCTLLNPSTVKTLYLDHYMQECASFFLTICNRIKAQPEDPWATTLNYIEGFEYEWGFVYELRIRETHIFNPPADGSDTRTELLETLGKEKVAPDLRFQLALTTRYQGEPELEKIGDNLFELHRTKTFACVSPELCTEIEGLIGREESVTLEFTHPQVSGDPLIAQRVISFEAAQ